MKRCCRSRLRQFARSSDTLAGRKVLPLFRMVRILIAVSGCLNLSIQPSRSSRLSNCPEDLPAKFRHYVTTYPMGKQLGLLISLSANAPALYLDSDVLFFPGAADFERYVSARDVPAFYLEDCQTSAADPRIFRQPDEQLHPVNCGALLFFKNLDWSLGIRRFLELEGEPNFFTNQTIAHLVLHANGARSFDPAKYVVQLDDQFVYRDRYAGRDLAPSSLRQPRAAQVLDKLVSLMRKPMT